MLIRTLSAFLVLLCLGLATSASARADALDDTLARFAADKFPESEKAVGELAASGAPTAQNILEALSDNRLYFDPGARKIYFKDASGGLFDARTGEKASAQNLKKVRVNNGLRSAIGAALGSMTLAAADPEKRIAAAEAVFKSRDAKALANVNAALSKETDLRAALALRQARAAILLSSADAAESDRLAAIGVLKERGDQDAQSMIDEAAQKEQAGPVKSAAQAALSAIQFKLALWSVAQNLWYGLSLSSVLLLAAIGLAITFGVMGVINMAHGEMVMLGAYTVFVVQSALPPSLSEWSLAISLPLAFIVAGIVGVVIERFVIQFLYGRPLETLLATWGVSLILQQAVRTIFGANNRQVYAPRFMSGGVEVGGLSITTGRLWIIVLAIIVFIALQLVLRLTSFGLRMRAVTQNRRMASAMGISTGFIDMLAFALGSGIAGVAGVALSQIDNVSPNLGQGYIIDSFMVVVLGGVGNLWGTLLGALTLGVANKLLEPFAGAVLGKIALLIFIILFIQKRPRGLFALKGRAVEA
ncbi:MAG TPA: urea ABC transporter permease subunit UrtB [Roseiarcus sp.]|jgi:urea transport system permease protein|nr:urea ABC transporter permease subunit UrtB [Roseiarcus sp.]